MLTSYHNKHIKIKENGIEYYSVKGLDSVKKEMLRLLCIIDDIAIKNSINYWIDGGSLIGVLRHDGFIPWDDDLDISLLKDDYTKLIEELSRYTNEHNDAYLFYKAPQKKHVCNYFARMEIYCREYGSHMLVPVKVDIRPLNCISDTSSSIKENLQYRDIANKLLYGKSYNYATCFPKNKEEVDSFFDFYNNNYGFDDPQNNGVTLVHPYFEFSNNFKLSYNDIFPLKRHKFEHLNIPIPNNFHYLLTSLYGDYMKLPNIENRAPIACEVGCYHIKGMHFDAYIRSIFDPTQSINVKFKKLYQSVKVLGVFKLLRIFIYEKTN